MLLKRFIPMVAGLTAFALALLLVARLGSSVKTVSAAASARGDTVVVLDAGHGGFDPGAIAADGTDEKDLNLAITLRLRDLMSFCGYTVVTTRNGDVSTYSEDAEVSRKKSDIHNRRALAESFQDSVLISLHQNAFSDRSQHGAQFFFGVKDPRSELLAECMRASIVELIQPENTRQLKKGNDSIYLLNNTERPTVLVECGFLTNAAELSCLKDPHYQSLMACSIFYGYIDYTNLEE